MASALNLCQHFEPDGTTCTSNDYTMCPHCQLQLCLRHLNFHQDYLRSDCDRLSDRINRLRDAFDHLKFDSTNQREYFLQQIDQWYQQQLDYLNRIYVGKQQQFHVCYLQAQIEFETYKAEKEKQFHFSLARQWSKVSRQKQIHIDDLNEMKDKLSSIERGIDDLKQSIIDLSVDSTTMELNIVKRRYVEAAKIWFRDDDDHSAWDIDDVDEQETKPSANPNLSPNSVGTTSSDIQLSTEYSSLDTIEKKAPLKVVIKRLQQPLRSKKVKYKFQTVSTSVRI